MFSVTGTVNDTHFEFSCSLHTPFVSKQIAEKRRKNLGCDCVLDGFTVSILLPPEAIVNVKKFTAAFNKTFTLWQSVFFLFFLSFFWIALFFFWNEAHAVNRNDLHPQATSSSRQRQSSSFSPSRTSVRFLSHVLLHGEGETEPENCLLSAQQLGAAVLTFICSQACVFKTTFKNSPEAEQTVWNSAPCPSDGSPPKPEAVIHH